jgi:hypothetical protein
LLQHLAISLERTLLMRDRDCCPCRKLNPTVFMMQATEDRLRDDITNPLDRPMASGYAPQLGYCREHTIPRQANAQ